MGRRRIRISVESENQKQFFSGEQVRQIIFHHWRAHLNRTLAQIIFILIPKFHHEDTGVLYQDLEWPDTIHIVAWRVSLSFPVVS